jgi:hypothetical protein
MKATTILAALAGMLAVALPAHAQATRTWVSGVGDDVNPCSRTAPCKTFAGAISKTAAGGEISVLDAGGFGAVTITKSISIVSDGAEGSILAAGTSGIIINAGANDVVTLHGLFIEGASTGTIGVRFVAGGDLHVRNCLIRGFQGGNSAAGIAIEPTATGARVFVSGMTLEKNAAGIRVKAASPAAPPASAFLDDVQVIHNPGTAVSADGANSIVRLNNSTITGNGSGLTALNGGQIISFGNNAIVANGASDATNGAPTGKAALQ